MDNTTDMDHHGPLPVPDILYDLSCVYLVAIGFAGAFLNTTSLVRIFKAIKVSFITSYNGNKNIASDNNNGIPNYVI